jgi:hypothetical protein
MKLLYIVVIGACLSICRSQAALAATASLQRDAYRIDAEQIDRDAAWLALLHYRARADGSMESEADRPQFFMSAKGKSSPHAELLAAATALAAPEQRQNFACRFPARYEWLRIRLGYDGIDTAIDQCPQLTQWLAGFPGRRISINFASSYLESPSSTFGHTFLKISRHSSNELLSPTINYAARTDARDSELQFVLKGLFGGFPGVVDELPFYRRLRTYTEIEGRDIHEYDLALTPDEVRRLLLHTWEIKDGIFDYYFVHENCAYRTLTLLDVVRPQAGLLKGFTTVTVPVDTIRALRSAAMLGEHRVWPSVPKQVRDLEAQITHEDATAARQLALGVAAGYELGAMPSARRASILQLAYEYGSVLIDRDEGDRGRRKEILGAITNARLELDNPEVLVSRAMPSNPEDGHDGGLVALGARRRGGQDAVSLEYAAFQHTLTNPLPGYESHAEISLLNPELELQRDQIRLRRLDWLVAQSTIPSSTLFSPRAWRLQLTTASQPFADREHLTTSVAYHSGKAWPLTADTVLSVLPGARIEASAALPHHAALAGALNASLTRQGAQWSAQVEILAEKFIAGSTLGRLSARATSEFRLSRNLSVAISTSRRRLPWCERELLISLKWRQRSLIHPFGRQ